MKATEVLMNEHRVIEQVLSCLEAIANQAEAGESLDVTSAAQAVEFFRAFADRCHHGKEEGHLFPLLESRGLRRENGPTGVLLSEHEQGRALLNEMSRAIETNEATAFIRAARSYVEMMRQHIWKEDQRLFQMAGQLLSPGDDDRLMEAFDSTERLDVGEGIHDNYLQLANELADRFGVAQASAPVICTGGCSHRTSHTPAIAD